MAKLFNLAKMTTSTSGTGTVTLGAAASGFLSFSDSGVADGDVITYIIIEGANTEIGRGTYAASGTTLSRDTVLNSSAGGSKITLAGSAVVSITASAQDFATTGTATVDFGSAPGTDTVLTSVTGQDNIYSTSQIQLWISGQDSTASHNAYTHSLLSLWVSNSVTSITPGVGFTFRSFNSIRLTGQVKVRWSWQ
jgi:hypothetical protein